jgi:hypothetical protein
MEVATAEPRVCVILPKFALLISAIGGEVRVIQLNGKLGIGLRSSVTSYRIEAISCKKSASPYKKSLRPQADVGGSVDAKWSEVFHGDKN